MANKVGKPLKFKTPAELQARIDAYFLQRDQDGKTPTLTSLYVFLGTYNGYFNELTDSHPEYTRTIKDTIARIAEYYEEGTKDKTTPPALGIFMLKNCGYTDRVEINATVSDNTSLTDMAKAAQRARAKQGKH